MPVSSVFPLKVGNDSAGNPSGIYEFQTGDVIPLTAGGTGASSLAQVDHGSLSGLGHNDHPHYATVSGDTFTGAVNFNAALQANGTATFDGAATFNDETTVDAHLSINNTVHVKSSRLRAYAGLSVSSDGDFANNVNVSGDCNVSSQLNVSGDSTLSGNLNVSSDINVSGNINGMPYPPPYASVRADGDSTTLTQAERFALSACNINASSIILNNPAEINWSGDKSYFMVSSAGEYELVMTGILAAQTDTHCKIRVRKTTISGDILAYTRVVVVLASDPNMGGIVWAGSLSAGDAINASIEGQTGNVRNNQGTTVSLRRIA